MNDTFWAWALLLFMGFMIFVGGFLMAESIKTNQLLKWQQDNWTGWQEEK